MSAFAPSDHEARVYLAAAIGRRIAEMSPDEMMDHACNAGPLLRMAMLNSLKELDTNRLGLLLHSAVLQGFREEVEAEVRQWAEEYENAQRRKYETPA